jgi:ribosomal protein S18 acetylase RimI-like enzyme
MTSGAMIRRLSEADAEAFVRIRREALEDTPFAFGSSPADDRAGSIDFVRAAVSDSTRAMFGAFAPNLAGIVGVYGDRSQKGAHNAHIWGVYVSAAHRGKGIGRALLKVAIEFAGTLPSVTHIRLAVSERTAHALKLYASLGFVTWGIEPAALRIDGVDAAEYHMVLVLPRLQ